MRKAAVIVMAFSALVLNLSSCTWIKEKTQETANKAGEFVGTTGTQFGVGVYTGVKKTFENDVKLSDQLQLGGIEIGEVVINSTDSTKDNILTTYVIFNNDIDREVVIKVFNESGKEYGRAKERLKGNKGEAKHIDFVFDKNVNLGTKGNVTIE